MNYLVNNFHKRAPRVAQNDYDSPFEGLLIKDKSSTTHQQNLKRLAIEMFKTKINQNTNFMNDIFRFQESSHTLKNEPFSLRNQTQLYMKLKQFLTDVVRFGTIYLQK